MIATPSLPRPLKKEEERARKLTEKLLSMDILTD